MKSYTRTLAAVSILLLAAPLGNAQSYVIYIENDQLLDPSGTPVNFGGTVGGNTVNVFYGLVSSSFNYGFGSSTPILNPTLSDLSALSSVTWSPMVDASTLTGGFADFMTPGGESPVFLPASVGVKPVVAIMNAAGPGSLQAGSAVALLEGVPFLSTLDDRQMSVGPNIGGLTALIGQSGSIQMVTVVPEPATYALALGALGLGLVLWRRMRR